MLALDVGGRRTGYCLSDPGRTIPAVSGVLEVSEPAALVDAVRSLVERYEVDTIVVGMPYSLAGGATPRTEATREVARVLEAELGVRVAEVDERLTSREAIQVMHELEESTRRKGRIDEIAARIILETYLRGESR